MERINMMAARHSAFYSPLLMTISGGFLGDEGLEPHYQIATPEKGVEESIASGEVHLSQSAVAVSFDTLETAGSSDIRHFAQINQRDGFFLASRTKQPDFSWNRLEGREVLVDHLFQPLAMFRYALHKLGVDERKVKMIDAGGVSDIDRAFRAGRGDYVHQQGPAPQQLEQDGVGYLTASVGEVIGPVAFSSLCASEAWLQTDMALAFMRAYRRARQYVIQADAQEISDREADFFPGIDRQVLTHTITTYQKLGCWSSDPVIGRQAYENLLDVFQFNGLISRRHAYQSCVVLPPDESPVQPVDK